eukprot:353025-Chlamydomonas_euryale.AAC.2
MREGEKKRGRRGEGKGGAAKRGQEGCRRANRGTGESCIGVRFCVLCDARQPLPLPPSAFCSARCSPAHTP